MYAPSPINISGGLFNHISQQHSHLKRIENHLANDVYNIVLDHEQRNAPHLKKLPGREGSRFLASDCKPAPATSTIVVRTVAHIEHAIVACAKKCTLPSSSSYSEGTQGHPGCRSPKNAAVERARANNFTLAFKKTLQTDRPHLACLQLDSKQPEHQNR